MAASEIAQNYYKKPDLITCAGGTIAGAAASILPFLPIELLNTGIMSRIKNISNLPNDEYIKIESATNQVLTSTGLNKHGIEVKKIPNRFSSLLERTFEHNTIQERDELGQILEKELNSGLSRFYPNWLKNFTQKIVRVTIENGDNAFYASASKKIVLPKNNLALCVFHEMGHAANHNLSTIGRLLQKSRFSFFGFPILSIPILFIAICKTKKAPKESPKGTFDKITNFIKYNAGKLTFLTFMPILLEEAMASIKGNGYAKKFLSTELAQKVSKTNRLAYLTYFGSTLACSSGVYLAVKVKDLIYKPQLIDYKT